MSTIITLAILCLLQWMFSVCSTRSCQYRHPRTDQIFNGIEIDPSIHGSRRKRSTISSLRIHFEYMDSFNSYKDSSYIKKFVMEPSRIALESALKAKNPTNGILRVNKDCIEKKYNFDSNGISGCEIGCTENTKCLSTTVPDKFLKKCRIVTKSGNVYYYGYDGEGEIDVDIILLVSVEYCTGDTYAHAASCFSEKQLDRPVLGILNICYGVLSKDRHVAETINIVKHEIIHTLGFAVDKYAFFRNPDGSPIVPRDAFGLPNIGIDSNEGYYLWNEKVTKKITRTRYSVHGSYQKTFDAFVLPNVVEVAQKHFNCPSIDAVDLEDFGGVGSALAHFDEYFLYNEIMTAETNKGIDILSKFTLALLKDTGWYEVDYAFAEDLYYGNSTGCTLPFKGCFKYMEYRRRRGQSLSPFCDRIFPSPNAARCSDGRKYYDYCYLTYFNSIKKENQYFKTLPNVPDNDVEHYLGKSEYNEFCPTKVVFSDPSSVCSDENNNFRKDRRNVIQSYFGPDSLCFENGLSNKNHAIGIYGASCQRYHMNAKKTQLTIYYGSQTISCPSKTVFYLTVGNVENVTFKCPDDLHLFPFSNRDSRPFLWRFYYFVIICHFNFIL